MSAGRPGPALRGGSRFEPGFVLPPGYVTTILEDAKIYSSHAKKSSVDADDVRLAIQCRTDQSFTSPPPRDVSTAAVTAGGGGAGRARNAPRSVPVGHRQAEEPDAAAADQTLLRAQAAP